MEDFLEPEPATTKVKTAVGIELPGNLSTSTLSDMAPERAPSKLAPIIENGASLLWYCSQISALSACGNELTG